MEIKPINHITKDNILSMTFLAAENTVTKRFIKQVAGTYLDKRYEDDEFYVDQDRDHFGEALNKDNTNPQSPLEMNLYTLNELGALGLHESPIIEGIRKLYINYKVEPMQTIDAKLLIGSILNVNHEDLSDYMNP